MTTHPPLTRSRQEKQKLIEQWQSSGKTMKAFSYEHQIKYATFISWIHPKKKRQKVSDTGQRLTNNYQRTTMNEQSSSGFIPVDIHKDSNAVFAEAKLGLTVEN